VRWLLAAGSVLAVLGAAELGLRLLAPASPAPLEFFDERFRYPAAYDPRLGYVPEVGDHPRTVWGVPVLVTPDGLRSNGGPSPPGAPILAVGDSFTWGDQVGDTETWPAHLERRLGRPVRNGGVFGYGLDQIVLRAEELVPELRPERIVVSFIGGDLPRNEFSYRFAAKPWFQIEDGRLVLRGVPVTRERRRDPWAALRWSRLAERIGGGLLGEHWWLPWRVREHDRGLEVALLLVERLADLGPPVLLVGQWDPGSRHAPVRTVLEHARRLGLATLDLEPPLRRLVERRPSERWRLFFAMPAGTRTVTGHMTRAGNAWVADRIAETLGAMPQQTSGGRAQRAPARGTLAAGED
jgi:hypothetical protein